MCGQLAVRSAYVAWRGVGIPSTSIAAGNAPLAVPFAPNVGLFGSVSNAAGTDPSGTSSSSNNIGISPLPTNGAQLLGHPLNHYLSLMQQSQQDQQDQDPRGK